MSERDYARKVTLLGKTSKDTPVSEIMTSRVLYVGADQTMQECMALMTEKRIRHLPVMEGDRVVGVVTIGDVGRAIISDQQFMLDATRALHHRGREWVVDLELRAYTGYSPFGDAMQAYLRSQPCSTPRVLPYLRLYAARVAPVHRLQKPQHRLVHHVGMVDVAGMT